MQRKFLSDECPNYKCLEMYLAQGRFGDLPDEKLHKLQHEQANNKIVFEEMRSKNIELFKLDTENVAEKVLQDLAGLALPTRYDSPWGYQQISLLIQKVKGAAKDLGLEVELFPLHATLPTGQVNAMAVNLPCSSKAFLLFDPELLTFCNILSKLYAQCLTANVESRSGNKKILRAVIESSPEIPIRLKGVLEAFVRTGRPGTSPPFSVDTSSIRLSNILRTSMEVFVVAHEFGHVYAGHLSELLSKLHMAAPVISLPTSHVQEFEADYFGLVLTVFALKKEGYELRHILGAIKLFFSSLDLAKRYADFKAYGSSRKFVSEASDTHPSNESRKKAIDEAIESFNAESDDLELAQQFYSLIDESTDLLWCAMTSKAKKIGSNDLCPCGSTKKYKRCCRVK